MCSTEAEWSDWFDRDDERGSGDWEILFDLRKAYPDQLCSGPLDIQVNVDSPYCIFMHLYLILSKESNYGKHHEINLASVFHTFVRC